MNTLTVQVKPQYVRLTNLTEYFPDGAEYRLHEVQRRLKIGFDALPEALMKLRAALEIERSVRGGPFARTP